jgi:hypothetical protein
MSDVIIGGPFANLVCHWSYNLLGWCDFNAFFSPTIISCQRMKMVKILSMCLHNKCCNYRKLLLMTSKITRAVRAAVQGIHIFLVSNVSFD